MRGLGGGLIEKCLLPSFSFLFRLFKLLSPFSMLEFLISSLTLGFLCGFRPVLRCHIKNGMCSQILRAVPHSWGLRQGEVMVYNSTGLFPFFWNVFPAFLGSGMVNPSIKLPLLGLLQGRASLVVRRDVRVELWVPGKRC